MKDKLLPGVILGSTRRDEFWGKEHFHGVSDCLQIQRMLCLHIQTTEPKDFSRPNNTETELKELAAYTDLSVPTSVS